MHRLARDSNISQATAYRYLHEALDVISSRAPGLQHVLADQEAANELILCLDGTLIHTDAVATRKIIGHTDQDDITDDDDPGYRTIGWFSGKHWCFGGNLQVLSNRDGRPLYIAPVAPGATHDSTAAEKHIFAAVWATGLWIFADKGYQGAGPRVKTPPKGNRLNPGDETIREIITDIRAPTEGGNAALKHYKALKHVSLCPMAITKITRSVLVLISLHYDPDWRSW